MSFKVPQSGETLLWSRIGGFGDVMQAATEIKLFKEKFHGVRVSLLVRPQYTEFVMTQPWMDGAIGGYKMPLSVLWQTVKKIRAEKFDWMTDLIASGGHSHMMNIFSGAKSFLGRNSERGYFSQLLEPEAPYKWAEENGFDIRDRSKPSIIALPEKKLEAEKILSVLPDKKLFACIGSGGTHLKLWHTKGWIEFIGHVLSEGWGVVLNGYGDVEEKIGSEIIANVGGKNVLNLIGKLDYLQMAGVAHSCSFCVGNDTGPLHLAALGGVPSMGLFMCPFVDIVGLRMPWFTEIAAVPEYVRVKWSDKNAPYLLGNLQAERVIAEFDKANQKAS